MPDITKSPARCVGGFICMASHAVLIAAMAAHLSRGRAICRLRIRDIWPDCASTALRDVLHFACCSFRRFSHAVRQPRCGAFALCMLLLQAIWPRCASTALWGICTLHVAISGDLAPLCVNHVAGHLHFACRSFRRLVPVVRQLRCGAFALLHVAPSGDLISLCADHAAGNLHIWHCSAPQLQQQ